MGELRKFFLFLLLKVRVIFDFIKGFFKTDKNKYISLSDFFNCEIFFSAFGYPLLYNNPGRVHKFRRLLFNFTCVTSVLTFLQIAISFVDIASSSSSKSYTELIQLVGHGGILLVILIKSVYIVLLNRSKIIGIIDDLDKNYPHSNISQKTNEVRKNLKVIKVFTVLINVAYFTCITSAILEVLIHLIKYRMHPDSSKPKLFSNAYYPFDKFQPFVYELLFLYEGWFIFFTGCEFAYTDLLSAELFEVVKMELDILGCKISQVEDEEEFNDLIETHQSLLDVCGRLKKIFAPLMLSDVLGTCAVLCIFAFMAFTVNIDLGELNYFYANILGIPVLFFHALVACYFADRITEATGDIANAAYNTDWYTKDIKYRKMVLLIMMRAQNEGKFTAWNFMDVNLETYKWVVETSYSYYSVLNALYSS